MLTDNHWYTKTIIKKNKTQQVHKIFTKTIGQSHKDNGLNPETI